MPRLPWRSAIVAGFVVTLVRPATWVVALAGFLSGGGAVLLTWPIVVLPTPSGLQNLLGAPISTLAFGNPSPELVRTAAILAGMAAVVLVTGMVVGAWAERRGIAMVLEGASGEGYTRSTAVPEAASGLWQMALVRTLSLLPPAAVFALSWSTLYNVTYQELILPEDLATPLPVRVIAKLPLVLIALAVTWLLADAAAAVGVRRLAAQRRSFISAWALGWLDLVRRPHRILGAALIGDLVLVAVAGPALTAAAIAWVRVREVLELSPNSPVAIAVVVLWVGIWLGSVVLAGVGAAVRAALLTMEGATAR
jgi:hypothetical protein